MRVAIARQAMPCFLPIAPSFSFVVAFMFTPAVLSIPAIFFFISGLNLEIFGSWAITVQSTLFTENPFRLHRPYEAASIILLDMFLYLASVLGK